MALTLFVLYLCYVSYTTVKPVKKKKEKKKSFTTSATLKIQTHHDTEDINTVLNSKGTQTIFVKALERTLIAR